MFAGSTLTLPASKDAGILKTFGSKYPEISGSQAAPRKAQMSVVISPQGFFGRKLSPGLGVGFYILD